MIGAAGFLGTVAAGAPSRDPDTEWRAVESPTGADLLAVATGPDGRVWAAGDHVILSGQGNDWAVDESAPPARWNALSVDGLGELWAAGVVPGQPPVPRLAKRGPEGWTDLGITGDGYLAGLAMGRAHGWAVGLGVRDGGGVSRSLRLDGADWWDVPVTGTVALTAVSLRDGQAVAVGYSGALHVWEADAWRLQASLGSNLFGVDHGPDGRVWAVGVGGVLTGHLDDLRWVRSDPGRTWHGVQTGPGDLVIVVGCGRDCQAGAETGGILEWDGSAWTEHELTSRRLRGVALARDQAYVVGDGGAIWRRALPTGPARLFVPWTTYAGSQATFGGTSDL